jgi:hypothetical protein
MHEEVLLPGQPPFHGPEGRGGEMDIRPEGRKTGTPAHAAAASASLSLGAIPRLRACMDEG